MKWETAKAEHIGGRDEQQDRVEILVSADGARRLLILADGMGGHRGGALASQAVVDTAKALWEAGAVDADDPKKMLAEMLDACHEAINKIGTEKNLQPRSTGVFLFTDGEEAHWATIGDSRLYRFKDKEFVERSRDHSVVQMLLDIGKITEEEMGTHPDQNRLTQSLGGDADPEPAFGETDIEEGLAFLLCSDGLWEMVTPKEMGEALASSSLTKAAKELAETAAQRAGKASDNITVALARMAPEGAAAKTVRLPWLAFVGVAAIALIAALALVFSFDPDETPVNGADTEQQDRAGTTGGDSGADGEEESEAGRTEPGQEEEDRSRSAIERPETDTRETEETERQEQRRTDRRQSAPLQRDPEGGALQREGDTGNPDTGTENESDPGSQNGTQGREGGRPGDGQDLEIRNLDRSENRPETEDGGPEWRRDGLEKDDTPPLQ